MNAFVTSHAHVGSHIEEIMSGDRPKNPGSQATTEGGTHSAHSERNQSHESTAVPKIKFEWDIVLKPFGVNPEMNHQHPIPIGDKQRFASGSLHPGFGPLAGRRRAQTDWFNRL